MLVMKFGGSALGTAERIQQIGKIVKKELPRKPVVVVSALGGVTDHLLETAEEARRGGGSVEAIRAVHGAILRKLVLQENLMDELLKELEVLLKGISMVKELTPRTLDYVCSFGERMSVRIVSGYFYQQNLPASAFDAFDIGMVTNERFGAATPLPEAADLIRTRLSKASVLPVITGYIGKTKSGDITTLGRNGSDYTASFIGAALGAEEIQMWRDVDGIMTADPSIIPDAKPLETMSFDEASELAYYGGQVLHPSAIIPAMEHDIPVRMLNIFNPSAKGTLILAHANKATGVVKSIVYKEDQIIIHITTPRMLMKHGFLAQIFDIFAKYQIVINIVATSEVSVSVTTDSPKHLNEAVHEFSEFAQVHVEKDKAIVCVVGEGLRETPGIAGEVFAALKRATINVLMISQGASKINLAFVIENCDIKSAVEALHGVFFKRKA